VITVIQRYLLSVLGTVTAVGASSTGNIQAVTPIIPLSGQWTIRLRGFSSLVLPSDNSGSLQVETFNSFWNFLSAGGVSLFSIAPFLDTTLVPSFVFPTVVGAFASKFGDMDQIVASTDIVGGVVAGLQATTGVFVHNSDAANPHSAQAACQAIVEFAQKGAS
jgi:hypothetical protein